MIVLNLKDGSSVKFDLSSQTDLVRFNEIGRSTRETSKVTGIWIITDKHNSTLPFPNRFRRVLFFAEQLKSETEVTGERISIQADDVRMVVTSYYGEKPKMVRIDLKHTGKQMFIPANEGVQT